MGECIFCKIVNKEIPAEVVYEDENIISFRDINPAAPIHILVIPKKHIEKVTDLNEEDELLIGKIYTVINKIAQEQNFAQDGFRVIVNVRRKWRARSISYTLSRIRRKKARRKDCGMIRKL